VSLRTRSGEKNTTQGGRKSLRARSYTKNQKISCLEKERLEGCGCCFLPEWTVARGGQREAKRKTRGEGEVGGSWIQASAAKRDRDAQGETSHSNLGKNGEGEPRVHKARCRQTHQPKDPRYISTDSWGSGEKREKGCTGKENAKLELYLWESL